MATVKKINHYEVKLFDAKDNITLFSSYFGKKLGDEVEQHIKRLASKFIVGYKPTDWFHYSFKNLYAGYAEPKPNGADKLELQTHYGTKVVSLEGAGLALTLMASNHILFDAMINKDDDWDRLDLFYSQLQKVAQEHQEAEVIYTFLD